jgi:hypothetical protein
LEKTNKMIKEFIPYDQALIMKDLGFDEPCFGYYNNLGNYVEDFGKTNSDCNKLGMYGKYCTAPLYQQVFRLFREEYNRIGVVHEGTITLNDNISRFEFYIDKLGNTGVSQFQEFVGYKTYEEAELACLNKLIEIVK